MKVLFVRPGQWVAEGEKAAQWIEMPNEYEAFEKLVASEVKVACTDVPGVYVAYGEDVFKDNELKPVNICVAGKYIPGDVFFVSFQSYFFVEITREQGEKIMDTYYGSAKIEGKVTTYEDFLSRSNGLI